MSVILYFIFSIPFLYLIKFWGHIIPTGDAASRLSNDLYFHHIGYSITLAFYLFPLILFKKKIQFRNLFSFKFFLEIKIIYYFLYFFYFYIFYLIFFYKYENEITLGKGFLYKVTILFSNLTLQSFLFISFYICWMIILFIKDRKIINNFIISYL